MLDQDARTTKGLCMVWKRVQANVPAGSEEQVRQVLLQLSCSP